MQDYTTAQVADLIAAFDATGVHRASTPGDVASGQWLRREAQALGIAVKRVPVPLPRTVVEEAYVECAGLRIDGLPMFDAPPAAAAVEGALSEFGGAGRVGYLELAPNAASIKGMPFEALRRTSPHAALVVATRVAGESLAPINAQFFAAPFGPPVLQVAGMQHAFLAEQARAGAHARLVCACRREDARSFNLAARVPARAAARRVVLLTPRTGWWESTAERAGGLVAWLSGLASAAALSGSGALGAEVRGYATCGHELGHVGLHALLAGAKTILDASSLWLHLGANLGCASASELTLRASDPSHAQAMRELLVDCGYPAADIAIEPMHNASGEARDVAEHGGRVLSLIGRNAHFHAASDRWPGNISAPRAAAIAQATARWVRRHAAAAVS